MKTSLYNISLPEAAKALGLSPHTLRAWVRGRKVPFLKLGGRILFDPKDVEELLARARIEPLPGREINRKVGGGKVTTRRAKQPKILGVIRARRFELVDGWGRRRASLSILDETPSLIFYHKTGAIRLMLDLSHDGIPELRFFGPTGRTIVVLGYLHDKAFVGLNDAEGNSAILDRDGVELHQAHGTLDG